MQLCSEREEMKNVAITTQDGVHQMSMLFESTVSDIFRKFDMLLNRELGYSEFRGFCECVDRLTSESEFNQILSKFSSTKLDKMLNASSQGGPASTGSVGNDRTSQPGSLREGGLTLEGFKQFLVNEIEANEMDEGPMFEWLASLGYDEDLYSIKSRCFMLTFHSNVDLSVSVRDAI